jgi:hypothetical protein
MAIKQIFCELVYDQRAMSEQKVWYFQDHKRQNHEGRKNY